MKKREFHFTAIAQLLLEHTEGDKHSRHCGLNFMLEPGPGLNTAKYVNPADDNLTEDGLKVMRSVLVSALAAVIHDGHIRKITDSAEAMREAIAQLETEFVQIAEVQPGIFKE